MLITDLIVETVAISATLLADRAITLCRLSFRSRMTLEELMLTRRVRAMLRCHLSLQRPSRQSVYVISVARLTTAHSRLC